MTLSMTTLMIDTQPHVDMKKELETTKELLFSKDKEIQELKSSLVSSSSGMMSMQT